MGMREKLIQILSVPIFPHELADPNEVVADYLLDNDVVPVVRCKDCEYGMKSLLQSPSEERTHLCRKLNEYRRADHFCSFGERRKNEG